MHTIGSIIYFDMPETKNLDTFTKNFVHKPQKEVAEVKNKLDFLAQLSETDLKLWRDVIQKYQVQFSFDPYLALPDDTPGKIQTHLVIPQPHSLLLAKNKVLENMEAFVTCLVPIEHAGAVITDIQTELNKLNPEQQEQLMFFNIEKQLSSQLERYQKAEMKRKQAEAAQGFNEMLENFDQTFVQTIQEHPEFTVQPLVFDDSTDDGFDEPILSWGDDEATTSENMPTTEETSVKNTFDLSLDFANPLELLIPEDQNLQEKLIKLCQEAIGEYHSRGASTNLIHLTKAYSLISQLRKK